MFHLASGSLKLSARVFHGLFFKLSIQFFPKMEMFHCQLKKKTVRNSLLVWCASSFNVCITFHSLPGDETNQMWGAGGRVQGHLVVPLWGEGEARSDLMAHCGHGTVLKIEVEVTRYGHFSRVTSHKVLIGFAVPGEGCNLHVLQWNTVAVKTPKVLVRQLSMIFFPFESRNLLSRQ